MNIKENKTDHVETPTQTQATEGFLTLDCPDTAQNNEHIRAQMKTAHLKSCMLHFSTQNAGEQPGLSACQLQHTCQSQHSKGFCVLFLRSVKSMSFANTTNFPMCQSSYPHPERHSGPS